MGVSVSLKDLHPITRIGTTYSSHKRLEGDLLGRIVAIDATQWVYLAYESHRLRKAQLGGLPLQRAFTVSATTLIADRVTQLLRYGAHPVLVLDGQAPPEKMRKGGHCRINNGPFGIHNIVQELCQAMGVQCIIAPGEGEALCAALNEQGIADVCFTSDAIDAFYFGAQEVIRTNVDHSNSKFLDHTEPTLSSFSLLNRETMSMYFGINIQQDHLKDVVFFFAALVGNDYDRTGVQGIGAKTAQTVIHAMYQHWQNVHVPAGHRCDFLQYIFQVLEGLVEVQHSILPCAPFLAKIAVLQDPSVIEATQRVLDVVRYQRHEAGRVAQTISRSQLEWTGGCVNHKGFLTVLRRVGVKEDCKNGVNGAILRVIRLEAERMLRLGESCLGKPLLRITQIVKEKEVRKWTKDGTIAKDDSFYQYLVDVTIQPDCDIKDIVTRDQLVHFAQTSKAWESNARVARRSAVEQDWPLMLAQHVAKCARQQQTRGNVHSKVRGDNASTATNSNDKVKLQDDIAARNVYTEHGTARIESYMDSVAQRGDGNNTLPDRSTCTGQCELQDCLTGVPGTPHAGISTTSNAEERSPALRRAPHRCQHRVAVDFVDLAGANPDTRPQISSKPLPPQTSGSLKPSNVEPLDLTLSSDDESPQLKRPASYERNPAPYLASPKKLRPHASPNKYVITL